MATWGLISCCGIIFIVGGLVDGFSHPEGEFMFPGARGVTFAFIGCVLVLVGIGGLFATVFS